MAEQLNGVLDGVTAALDAIMSHPFNRPDALCTLADLIFYTYDGDADDLDSSSGTDTSVISDWSSSDSSDSSDSPSKPDDSNGSNESDSFDCSDSSDSSGKSDNCNSSNKSDRFNCSDGSNKPESSNCSNKSDISDNTHGQNAEDESKNRKPRIYKRFAVKDLKTAIQMLLEALKTGTKYSEREYTISAYRCYVLVTKYVGWHTSAKKGRKLLQGLLDKIPREDSQSDLEALLDATNLFDVRYSDDSSDSSDSSDLDGSSNDSNKSDDSSNDSIRSLRPWTNSGDTNDSNSPSEKEKGYMSDSISEIFTRPSPPSWTWKEEAFESIQEGLRHTPITRSDRTGLLKHLRSHLTRHRLAKHTIHKQDKWIDTLRERANGLRDQHGQAKCLSELAELFHLRFEAALEASDELDGEEKPDRYLNEAVELAQDALLGLSAHTASRADYIYDLAELLYARYRALGSVDDLTVAIQWSREALNVASQESRPKSCFSYAAGCLLFVRWSESGDLGDLHEALRLIENALSGDRDRVQHALYADTLRNCIMARFENSEKTEGLEAAMLEYLAMDTVHLKIRPRLKILPQVQIYATSLPRDSSPQPCNSKVCLFQGRDRTPTPEDNIASWNDQTQSNYLASQWVKDDTEESEYDERLRKRLKRLEKRSSLPPGEKLSKWAIPEQKQQRPYISVAITSEYDADDESRTPVTQAKRTKKLWKASTGNINQPHSKDSMLAQFGARKPLNTPYMVVAPRPLGSARMLHSLARDLTEAYKREGSREKLMAAIDIYRELLRALPVADLHGRKVRVELSRCLFYRFKLLDVHWDLVEARYHLSTIILYDAQCDPYHLHLLGTYLMKTRTVIKLVLTLSKAVVEATSRADMHMPLYLGGLANAFHFRHQEYRGAVDLEVAFLARQHVALSPTTTPMDAADALRACVKYRQGCSIEQKQYLSIHKAAIRAAELALETSEINNPQTGKLMWRIAKLSSNRFKFSDSKSDQNRAIHFYMHVPCSVNLSTVQRIFAGIWASEHYVRKKNWSSARRMLETTVRLLADLPFTFRQAIDLPTVTLHKISEISIKAAAAILQDGGIACDALLVLETGRGFISGQIIDSRSDISTLKRINHEIYDHYRIIRGRTALSEPKSYHGFAQLNEGKLSIKRYRNQLNLALLQHHIRDHEGFETFCLPPSPAELVKLSSRGPIVVFNVVKYRSDALLVTQHDGVTSLSLPDLKETELEEYARKLMGSGKITSGLPSTKSLRQQRLKGMLEWLWNVAVRPVLQQLRLLTPEGPLPHIWWVTSGPMGMMPLHAAGNAAHTTTDYVVSSYIPTLKSLHYARERNLQPLLSSTLNILIAAMPQTPNMPPLATEKEVEVITQVFDDRASITTLIQPTKSQVLQSMEQSHIVHLACHGRVHISPKWSHLILNPSEDPSSFKSEELTIEELVGLRREPALIAYLSACSTAEMVDIGTEDEITHLAHAFQLVGFPHVVGTLWETDDRCAIEVAETFYKTLTEQLQKCGESIGHEVVSYALHVAVCRLKKKKPGNVLGWAPFVHIGA